MSLLHVVNEKVRCYLVRLWLAPAAQILEMWASATRDEVHLRGGAREGGLPSLQQFVQEGDKDGPGSAARRANRERHLFLWSEDCTHSADPSGEGCSIPMPFTHVRRTFTEDHTIP